MTLRFSVYNIFTFTTLNFYYHTILLLLPLVLLLLFFIIITTTTTTTTTTIYYYYYYYKYITTTLTLLLSLYNIYHNCYHYFTNTIHTLLYTLYPYPTQVLPPVSTASTAFMSLLNTTSNVTHYLVLGTLPIKYAVIVFIIGALGKYCIFPCLEPWLLYYFVLWCFGFLYYLCILLFLLEGFII